MQHLAAAATGAGAAVSADTRVDRLVVDDGRVVGVQAQRFGETVSLRARARRRPHRGRLHLQRRHVAPALPAPRAGNVQGRHRGRRRAGHPHGAGHRRRRAQHVRGRGLAADHPAAHVDPRHPRQRQGSAVHQRGHLHGTRRPVRPLRAGRRGLPHRRRGVLRGELDGPRRHAGSARRPSSSSQRWACRPARSSPPSTSTTATPRRGRTRSSTRARPGSARWCPRSAPSTSAIGPAPYAPFTLGGLETTVAGEVLDLTGRADPGALRGRAHHGRCVLVRVRQWALHRGQHDVRPFRGRERNRGRRGGMRRPGARGRASQAASIRGRGAGGLIWVVL